MPKLPKRVSTALLNALAAGVVPRVGLEQIAVGREAELRAIEQDLANISAGGAAFRFIVGRYGSGKSFMLQLLRNAAMNAGFVVADADLSPELRLAGSRQQAVATYRELLKNLATRTCPRGGAIALILEKWLSSILNQVAQATGGRPGDPEFDQQVEAQIRQVVSNLEGLVHGFDFANVIVAYWRGYREDDTAKKDAVLRWLRGEFASKVEARAALDVRAIVDDDTWYDYLKLLAQFAADIGYQGLIVILDEAVHLYKVSHSRSRQSNYDRLLAMFNDTVQGKADALGFYIGGTPQFVEDERRGLYSDPAWRTRLERSRFLQDGLQDNTAPTVVLEPLSAAQIAALLHQLAAIHSQHYGYQPALGDREIATFQQAIASRLGADLLLTPREIVRDFISILNVLQQNPQLQFADLLDRVGLTYSSAAATTSPETSDEFAEFTL